MIIDSKTSIELFILNHLEPSGPRDAVPSGHAPCGWFEASGLPVSPDSPHGGRLDEVSPPTM